MFIHCSNTRKQIFVGTAAFADSQCRLCIEFVQRAAAGMRPKQFCNAIPGILTKMQLPPVRTLDGLDSGFVTFVRSGFFGCTLHSSKYRFEMTLNECKCWWPLLIGLGTVRRTCKHASNVQPWDRCNLVSCLIHKIRSRRKVLQRLRRGNGVLSLWEPPYLPRNVHSAEGVLRGHLAWYDGSSAWHQGCTRKVLPPRGFPRERHSKAARELVFQLYSIILLVYVGVSRVWALASQWRGCESWAPVW